MSSIKKRGKASWLLTLEVGYGANGERLQEYKTVKVTDPYILRAPKRLEQHLQDELAKFKVEVETGEYVTPEKMTFAAFVVRWKANFVSGLEETTRDNYHHYADTRILPFFEKMDIGKIKTMHVLDFMATLDAPDARLDKSGPLKSASKVMNYRVLSSIFQRAVDWNVIKEKANPMKGVRKPKEDDVKEMEVYDEREIKLLFEALEHEDLKTRLFVIMAFVTGMRRGELAGLEWQNISFESNTIYITQNITKSKDGVPVLKAPKNKKPRRVSMSKTLVEELLRYREERCFEIEMVDQITDRDFVFSHPNGGHYNPQWFTNKWIEFHRRHNLKPIRLHDLRHTSVSWMIFKRIHSETIAKRVGHSNIKLLQRYGHIFDTVDQEAAASFDDI